MCVCCYAALRVLIITLTSTHWVSACRAWCKQHCIGDWLWCCKIVKVKRVLWKKIQLWVFGAWLKNFPLDDLQTMTMSLGKIILTMPLKAVNIYLYTIALMSIQYLYTMICMKSTKVSTKSLEYFGNHIFLGIFEVFCILYHCKVCSFCFTMLPY